jgi:DNA gyrase/topoisomerase IV subunit B
MDCATHCRTRQRGRKTTAKRERTTFHTSRFLVFCSAKELTAQTGHDLVEWPLVILKELLDNGLDASEEAGATPNIKVVVKPDRITISDNGPGIPAETITSILYYSIRASSREAYVSPTRGMQGNAVKTVLAMPFVLDGNHGRVDISAHGQRHEISFAVDRIRQEPTIKHTAHKENVRKGTTVTVWRPDSACSKLADAEARLLQIADDYTWLNPHLTLSVEWFDRRTTTNATDPKWNDWKASQCDPASFG